ncbi:MAG: hypothetical protein AAGJ79_00135 [Verrucomicrobiota bacterium]
MKAFSVDPKGILILANLALFSIQGEAASIGGMTIGGITFDQNAFVDELVSSSNLSNLSPTVSDFETVLTDNAPNTGASIGLQPPPNSPLGTLGVPGFVVLRFTDNILFNGPGFDLALFDFGGRMLPPPQSESFLVMAVGVGPSLEVFVRDTNFDVTIPAPDGRTFDLQVALVDLDLLGIPPGGQVAEIMISSGTTSSIGQPAELALVGAINSIPIPEFSSPLNVLLVGFLVVSLPRRSRSARSARSAKLRP